MFRKAAHDTKYICVHTHIAYHASKTKQIEIEEDNFVYVFVLLCLVYLIGRKFEIKLQVHDLACKCW